MANLCFIENEKEVTSTSNSSYDDCEYNNNDDESSIVNKLMLKCKRLLSKKKLYKHELSSLT